MFSPGSGAKQRRPLIEIDGWVRGRLRRILRRRNHRRARANWHDNQTWPSRYFRQLGLFSLEQVQQHGLTNLQNEASSRESQMREIRPFGSEGGVDPGVAPFFQYRQAANEVVDPFFHGQIRVRNGSGASAERGTMARLRTRRERRNRFIYHAI